MGVPPTGSGQAAALWRCSQPGHGAAAWWRRSPAATCVASAEGNGDTARCGAGHGAQWRGDAAPVQRVSRVCGGAGARQRSVAAIAGMAYNAGMAFCTNCGASVAGTFCNQCGTPSRAGAPQAPAEPAKRRTHPLVWVMAGILGIFVIGFLAILGTGVFVVRKIHQAGVDPELFRTNPGLAVSKLITAANPDAEVLRTDDGAGTITIRDRRTGKQVTLSFDEARSGNLKFNVEEGDKTASVQIGGENAKLPSWVPVYPGVNIRSKFTARGESRDGVEEGGSFTFITSDSASKVLSFYRERAKELGMKVNLSAAAGDGGTLILTDENKRTLTVVVGGGPDETSVNVTYGAKR